jgi:hypothetical protein
LDNKIDGASIVLLDIDSLKKALEQNTGRAASAPPGEAGQTGTPPHGGAEPPEGGSVASP